MEGYGKEKPLRQRSRFHQSVILTKILQPSTKIVSCEVKKIHIDYDKVLNHSYIIILHVHYNIVACRRTVEHDVTKCSQLQSLPHTII